MYKLSKTQLSLLNKIRDWLRVMNADVYENLRDEFHKTHNTDFSLLAMTADNVFFDNEYDGFQQKVLNFLRDKYLSDVRDASYLTNFNN